MRTSKLIMIMLATMILLAGNLSAKEGDFSSKLDAKEVVKLDLFIGDLYLKSANIDKVLLQCEYDLDRDIYVEPNIRERNSYVKIKADFEGSTKVSWGGKVTWTLTVPHGTEIDYSSTSGDVIIKDFDGQFKGNTASGDLELSDCDGDFKFNTASGDIDIFVCNGDFNLNTASGNISLKESKGHFRLNSASGDVNARQLSLEDDSKFSTASGDVKIMLDGMIEHDLAVTSASGTAVLDLNGNKITGYLEMRANYKRGKIVCPFEFDDVSYEKTGGRDQDKRVIKSLTIGDDAPVIEIATGSGKAKLIE